jgi:hypothetical protein
MVAKTRTAKRQRQKLLTSTSPVIPAPSLERSVSTEPPFLCTRRQAAHLLGVSIATLIRMEAAGTLRPIKLNREAPAAMVHYRRDDLLLLARG